jgi:excisionase family DNA binding protein
MSLISIAETSKRLNLPQRTIANALRAGKVPSVRVNGYRRIDERDLPKLGAVMPKPSIGPAIPPLLKRLQGAFANAGEINAR